MRRGPSGAPDAMQGGVPAGTLEGAELEMELAPFPISLEDRPNGRPTFQLCVAEGYVLYGDLLAQPPAEPERMAIQMADALRQLCQTLGERPSRVLVRHTEMAGPLASILSGDELEVVERARLPGIDRVLPDLYETAGLDRDRHPPIRPDTWAGWSLPETLVADLFEASAEVYRSAPWSKLWDRHGFWIETRGGRRWLVHVIGALGESFGIVLYSKINDWHAMRQGLMSRGLLDRMAGSMISLHYDRKRDLHPAMRREVRKGGWTVASDEAWPHVFAFNTPGGALIPSHAADLLDVLRALPRFVEEALDEVLACERDGRPLHWQDADAGITIAYDPDAVHPGSFGRHGPDTSPRPCLIQGPEAEPEAALNLELDPEALRAENEEFVRDFELHLEAKGRGQETVQRHAVNAELFLDFLAGQGVPIRSMSECDLRVFVFDWMPRKIMQSQTEARAVPVSLRQFFAFLEEKKDLAAPWAKPLLLDEREAIEERWESCPGNFWFSGGVDAWRGIGMQDLVRRGLTHDGSLGEDLAFGRPLPDSEVYGMTLEEARVEHLLTRQWLLWHDEVLAEGVESRAELIARLEARRDAWTGEPNAALDGRSPSEVVLEAHSQSAQGRR